MVQMEKQSEERPTKQSMERLGTDTRGSCGRKVKSGKGAAIRHTTLLEMSTEDDIYAQSSNTIQQLMDEHNWNHQCDQ